MLAVLACLTGIFALLLISEILDQKKIIRGDQKRKFIHITCGTFIAFWPWLVSWQTIAWLGVAMLLVVLLNHKIRIVDFHSNLNRHTYGDIFFALGIVISALMTDSQVFFAVAILIMTYADSLANIVGREYGKGWGYNIFGHHKTVVGSMVMWLASLYILGIGLLYDYQSLSFASYTTLILLLPPVLVLVENFSPNGFDDLLIPVAVILALNLAA